MKQLKNNLVDISLLGTDKKQLSLPELPAPLQEYLTELEEAGVDVAEQFLKASSLGLAYYRAGMRPSKIELVPDEAAAEELAYCSDKAMALLSSLLDEKYYTLTWFWAVRCNLQERIVQPDMLSRFFDWGVSDKKYYTQLFVSVIGNRGVWLSKFNPQWDFIKTEEEITDWETASLQQRVAYLQKVRETEPTLAIDKIRAAWKEENAAARTALLSPMEVNLSIHDEAFLIEALLDKSKQVKEKAMELLKLIPDSAIIKGYQNVLFSSIKLKESKFLGLISRTGIEVNLQVEDEEIFKTGIDKLSNDKKINDSDYILSQLISQTPPGFWNAHFGLSVAEIVKLFAQKEELQKFQLPLCKSAVKFGDREWALELLKQFEVRDAALLKLLKPAEHQEYAEKLLKENLEGVMESFLDEPFIEWNLNLARAIITETAQNPHRYHKGFYESACLRLPQAIIPFLNSIPFAEEWKKNMWSNYSVEIEKLINLKESIKTQTF